jgi:hypothetical protein
MPRSPLSPCQLIQDTGSAPLPWRAFRLAVQKSDLGVQRADKVLGGCIPDGAGVLSGLCPSHCRPAVRLI